MKRNIAEEKRVRLLAYLEAHPDYLYGVSCAKRKDGSILRPRFTRTGDKYCSPFKGQHIANYFAESFGANPYDTLGRKVALLAFAAQEATQGFNENEVPAAIMADFILANETKLTEWLLCAIEGLVRLNMSDEIIKHDPPFTGFPLLDLRVG